MTTKLKLTITTQPEDGAGMVEYALLATFIAIVALVGIKLLGTALNDFFSTLSTSI